MNPAFLAQTACIWEATSRKVGNVHPAARFADTEYHDFILSAAAMAESFRQTDGQGLGSRIEHAVTMSRAVVPRNTNLGIILLLTPLLSECDLTTTTVEDCQAVYRAIRMTQPGGMGKVESQDIQTVPDQSLIEVMRLAQHRDLIARQYVHNFVDVYEFGVPILLQQLDEFRSVEAAIISTQLHWLSEFPDSLIARKCGEESAIEVRKRARNVLKLGGLHSDQGLAAGRDLDAYLRSRGNLLNPGTTADLITACLFVALRDNSFTVSESFRWHSPNWLPL